MHPKPQGEKIQEKLSSLIKIWSQFVIKLDPNSESQSGVLCMPKDCIASSFRHALVWLMPFKFGNLTKKPKTIINPLGLPIQFQLNPPWISLWRGKKHKRTGVNLSISAENKWLDVRPLGLLFLKNSVSGIISRQWLHTWPWHPVLKEAVQWCLWFFLILLQQRYVWATDGQVAAPETLEIILCEKTGNTKTLSQTLSTPHKRMNAFHAKKKV